MSFLFLRPQWEKESIGEPDVPDVYVCTRTEASAVARNEAQIVANVIVQAEVESLCVCRRQAIAPSVQDEELLHAGNCLNTLK